MPSGAARAPLPCLQVITINLGGLTLAMFFSLRFLASIVLSKLLLGSTIVSNGLQVGDVDGARACCVVLHRA